MMDIVKIGCMGLVGVVLALTLKNQKSEYSFFISMAVCVVIFGFFIVKMQSVITYALEIGDMISIDAKYVEILLKMMGIAYVAEFSAALCKDAGYSAIATQIELFAKITIMLLSMPVLFAFIKTVGEFL